MAFPNVSDIVATTIESRTRQIADNVTKNNVLLSQMKMQGNIKTASGGSKILEELSFAENSNAGWYSGYDLLPVGVSDVISAAEFNWKQAAVPVTCSGLEQLQNAGREQMIDLIDTRMDVAESTLANLISEGLYSDGTGSSGKEIDGLDAAVPANPATGTYGGIDRATWTFWASKIESATFTAANIQQSMNALWAKTVRGADRPNLVVLDNNLWEFYMASLQAQQRFNSPEVGALGFPALKFMGDCNVVYDGGIGGFCPASTGFMLNTKYIKYRPHAQRNMVPLNPSRRYAVNQDAEVQILAWAGNMTTRGAQFQGRLVNV